MKHIGIYPVFDKRFPGRFLAETGAVLLDMTTTLEELAAARGIRTFESFHAYAHVELPPDFAGDPHDIWLQHDAQWHDPASCIPTVETLMGAVLCERPVVEKHSVQRVVEALEELRLALVAAAQAGARFNFQVFDRPEGDGMTKVIVWGGGKNEEGV
jgi:hypothetical protein